MKLSEYFEKVRGLGVLATVDADGRPNMALYSRPHFLNPADDAEVAFIMTERHSHANLLANSKAAYLFVEEGEGYEGKRLALTMLREETDMEKIRQVRRRVLPAQCDVDESRYLVYFRVDRVIPLIGRE